MNSKGVIFIIGLAIGVLFSSLYFLNILNNQKSSYTSLQNQHTNLTPDKTRVSMNSLLKNYSDLDYLNLMIIQSQDSIDVAKRAVINSTNSFIKDFSNNVIVTQTKQINEMKIEIDKIINPEK